MMIRTIKLIGKIKTSPAGNEKEEKMDGDPK